MRKFCSVDITYHVIIFVILPPGPTWASLPTWNIKISMSVFIKSFIYISHWYLYFLRSYCLAKEGVPEVLWQGGELWEIPMYGTLSSASTHRWNHKDPSERYVVWLSEVSEARASSWFNDTWTCERGNYTNATAGYKGNHLSSGIKSPWRYRRRYTVVCAGATQRISLEVFAPSLIQYISIRSKKHVDKILCPNTVLMSFHLKLCTSHPRTGKRFRTSHTQAYW